MASALMRETLSLLWKAQVAFEMVFTRVNFKSKIAQREPASGGEETKDLQHQYFARFGRFYGFDFQLFYTQQG